MTLSIAIRPALSQPWLLQTLRMLGGGLAALVATSSLRAAEPLTLAPGEHVAIVGNALADRMQHHGWLETMIHAQYPSHRLVVRNLGFSGDEVALRARSLDFGTPDEWLTRVQAGVVFAFFGFNESFRGPAGLPRFKEELDRFLRETRAKNYNGLGPPRIVLFSPIASESLPDLDRAVSPQNNINLALYTAAMAEVAADRDGVTFVNLFDLSQKLYADAAQQGTSLTFNGVHLTEGGEAKLAAGLFPTLFGGTVAPTVDPTLRAAVNEKNELWHARYRTLDGYNVYGGRSQNHTYFAGEGVPKITNADVMRQEFAQREVQVVNGDRRVWSLAQGRGPAVDELPLPPVMTVPTSKPGTNPDGSHLFLGAEEAITKMTLHPGLEINLFASEAQFPELTKPVQMAWDSRGRLWVTVWPNYPLRTPESKSGDRVLILEDTDGDGRADRSTTFMDNLDCPTGFQFYKDGILLVQAPDIWYVRDTDGDGRADSKERVLMGMDSADTHHQANSLALDPGGAVYLSDGVFHRTQVETAAGPVRNIDAAIYRYEPNTGKFETYVAYGFANPHGRSFDRWGNDLITDATGNRTFFGPAFSGRIDYPAKHPEMKVFWPNPSRPSAGSTILTSRHFPAEFQGNFLNGNVIRFQGVYRVKVEEDGSGLKGEQLTDFLSSTDPNFRPVGIDVGPDGAVYVLDWHSPIIAHTNLNHLRDPNRGRQYGRIYRVKHRDRALLTPPKIHGQPVAALLELLKEPEYRTRELAKIELDRHPREAVVAGLRDWIRRLDTRDSDYQHHLMEALWVFQWQNTVDLPLLERMLRSPEPMARAAATRVVSYWRERVPNALALLRIQAADEHPRVRLHAVRAASFFRSPDAVDVALTALRHPLDYYLEYTLGETIRQLKPHWRDSLAGDSPLLAGDPARMRYLLRTVTDEELMKLPRKAEVLELIVVRPSMLDSSRAEALATLAGMRSTAQTDLILGFFAQRGNEDVAGLGRLLVQQPRAELQARRARLSTLAMDPATPGRSFFWTALIVADGSLEAAWKQAEGSNKDLTELLTGIPSLPDAALRASAYSRLLPLVERSTPTTTPPAAESAELKQAAIRAVVSTRQETSAQFQMLSRLIREGEEVTTAAEGIRGLPRASWRHEDSGPLAKALIDWGKKAPATSRRGVPFLGVLQLTQELIDKLPAEEAAGLRPGFLSLRTSSFLIRTVPEAMSFDVPRLVVEAGKEFVIVFQNPDAMPHNLVIVKPGARERVGFAALELRPDYVDSRGRAFVPDSPDVIAATKLVDPGKSETINVTAPLVEGVYEYVCTFPGHWVTMWGQLVVTKNPATALASSDMTPPDPPKAKAAPHAHPPR